MGLLGQPCQFWGTAASTTQCSTRYTIEHPSMTKPTSMSWAKSVIWARVFIFVSNPLSPEALLMTTKEAQNILLNMHVYFKYKHSLGCQADALLLSLTPSLLLPSRPADAQGYLAPFSGTPLGEPGQTALQPVSSLRGKGTRSADLGRLSSWPCLQP